ncbi:MAG: methyltransferase, TIGR04325 family [Flavobacteriia bacterium]|nr:methyltransferase, TIGR04325 family [Flavobacteriia bacterium]
MKNKFFEVIKKILVLKEVKYGWSGDYSSWEEVQKQCDGYDSLNIIEITKQSLLKVKKGEAIYERDGFLFEKKEYSWPLISGLLKCQTELKELSVLDFGGSLGSTYFQCKDFINDEVNWGIVEQNHYFVVGKKNFEDQQLKFYKDLESCLKQQKPNLLLLSSVLQYIENYEELIALFLKYDFKYIVIDRNAFISGEKERITLQRVPPEIYEASYPCRFFVEEKFLNLFNSSYVLVADFQSYCDGSEMTNDGKKLYWKGFIFKKK